MTRRKLGSLLAVLLLIAISINLALSSVVYAQDPDEETTSLRPFKAVPSNSQPTSFGAPQGEVSAATSDEFPLVPESGPISAVILLDGQPAGEISASYADPTSFAAQSAANKQASSLLGSHQLMTKTLTSTLNIDVIGELLYLSNGLVVNMDASQIDQVKALPGVKAVIPDQVLELENSQSVPAIRATAAWLLSTGYTGQGIRIGIIDSGIDYTHANFGGSGSVAVYNANDSTDISDIGFDGSKVVGGYDFVGDTWTGGAQLPVVGTGIPSVPGGWMGSAYSVGDNDPIDCDLNGHGSHVAGTVAGFGVDGAGLTYTGSYPPADFNSMMIGPGVAPEAELYALKIGGCTTSVSFAAAMMAVDFAMDPNGDGNISDHLDVTNSSYGGAYGSALEPLTQAFNTAAANGIIMVGSAGNEGDTYYVHGEPNIAGAAISVASSAVDTYYSGLEITSGPAGAFPSYPTVIAANPSQGGALGVYGPTALLLVGGGINNQGCAIGDYAAFAGEVGLIIWDASASGCGSGTRMTNAVDAGGVSGLVVVSADPADDPFINLACTYSGGPSSIPCVSVTAADGAILQSNPGAFTVTFDDSLTAFLGGPSRMDMLSGFSSRGPANDGGTGIVALKPDVTAPGDAIYSTAAGTGNQAIQHGGTSMAAPHITGVAALMRQIHPTYSVAEIKALIMNTATHDLFTDPLMSGDRYGVSRIGAGRVDVGNAIQSDVVAYSTSAPEQVSVSYGLVEVVTSVSLSQSITVSNKGSAPQSYNISFQQMNDVTGASFSVSPSSITVGAGATRTVTVTLTANKAQMIEPHLPDPTTPETQAGAYGNLPRHWLMEEGGYVVLTATTATADLRVPVHAVVRPASDMHASANPMGVGPGVTGSAPLLVDGDEIYTGSNTPYDIISQVSAFELVYEDPLTLPGELGSGDIQYIGITSDFPTAYIACGGDMDCAVANTYLYFAIVTYDDWNEISAFDAWFDIGIDSNEDDVYDTHVFNFETGYLANSDWTDTVLTWITDGESWVIDGGNILGAEAFINEYSAASLDTYVMNNNVIVLPIAASSAGLTGANTDFQFDVLALSHFYFGDWLPDVAPYWITYDIASPTYSFTDVSGLAGGPWWGISMWNDLNGNFVPVDYDLTAWGAGPYPSILLLHHHNAANVGRAEVITVEASTDVAIDLIKEVDNDRPDIGDTVTFTITAVNQGPAEASDLILEDTLPAGLTYVSDTCPGVSTVTPVGDGTTSIECDLTGLALPNGFQVSYDIAATVDDGVDGTLTNSVTLTGWNPALTIFDGNGAPGPDTASVDICVGACHGQGGGHGPGGGHGKPHIHVFDPAISKLGTLPVGSLGLPGEQLTWTVIITNEGDVAGTDVVVSDTVRPEMRVDGADISSGTASISGQQVTFTIPVINPGETVTAHIYTTVLSNPDVGQLTNTVTLSGLSSDGTTTETVTETATGMVTLLSSLPSTGYSPDESNAQLPVIWLVVAGALVLVVLAGGAYTLAERQR